MRLQRREDLGRAALTSMSRGAPPQPATNLLPPRTLLDVLPKIGRDQVLAATRKRSHAKRDVLIRQGEEADSLFMVDVGSLAARLTTAAGDVVLLSVLGPGDVFGEVGVFMNRQERTATISALTDVVVHVLRREDFEALRHSHPEVNDFLLQLMARRTDRLSRLIAEAHFLPVDKRIARRLLEAGRHFSQGVLPVTVPLTQDEIAQLAGTTRPTTNQVLKMFEDAGVISLQRGRVEIRDVAGLRAFCR